MRGTSCHADFLKTKSVGRGKCPPVRAGMRGQAPLIIGRTDNAEIGTEPMGEAPRAGFEPARGNPAVFETAALPD